MSVSKKPRAEIFELALSIAGFPDVSYMIGDNLLADIQGGKDAGMQTILVNNEDECNADYRCDNLSGITRVLI